MNSHQDQKNAFPPIVVLDVDETLILGKNEYSLLAETFNDNLIDAMIKSGMKEIYLLTACRLNILKTKEERNVIKPLTRVDLIRHLKKRNYSKSDYYQL